MSTLSQKIDFAVVLRVRNANPNGDPLSGNRPRTDYSGIGEITDVCLKRKIRDRLVERWQSLEGNEQDGHAVYVQSDDRKVDDYRCLRDRAEATLAKAAGVDDTVALACRTWIDVRAFGQLFAFPKKGGKGKKKEDGDDQGGDTGVSIPIRGPVTVQSAFSLAPVSVTSTQITKSASNEGDGSKRGSDTMGLKHRVDGGIYVFKGSMNPQLAERTGFSDQDAETFKTILPRLFENDASSARPEGSMEVLKVVWWTHGCKAGRLSSAKVHDSLTVAEDGSVSVGALPGIEMSILDGF